MTTATPETVEAQIILMRAEAEAHSAEAAKARADTVRILGELRWFPYLPLATSAGFVTLALALGTWLGRHLP